MMEMEESQELYYETKLKQRALHEKVTGLRDKNAPAHALLECVFSVLRAVLFLLGHHILARTTYFFIISP